MASRLSLFLAELKRRKVYNVAAVYAAVGVAIAIAVPDLFGAFAFPPWAAPLVIVVIAIGFPVALVLAWAYEVRPEEPPTGIASSAEPVRKLDFAEAAPASPGDTRKSIVVLPFDNMSPDPGDAYFADGLTEEIITNFSFIRSLRVISRSSAMVLKGTQKDVRTIGRELGVQYVLEGSVRKAGDTLRITAQLIDASRDEHLWAERYDGVLEDVFGMQEEVSRSIVDALELRLTSEEDRRIRERRIDNVPAYECYLKAIGEVWQGTPESIDGAIRHLDHALEILGPNSYLYAGMAFAHWERVNLGLAQEETIALADEYVSKALALDPELPIALTVRGLFELAFRANLPEATRLLMRALRSNPDESLALGLLAVLHINNLGAVGPAERLLRRLVGVDPLGALTHWLLGALPFFQGEYEEASAAWRRMSEMTPDAPIGKFYYALALAYAGDRQASLAVLRDPELPEGGDVGSRFCRILGCALLDDREGALRELTPEFRKTVKRDGSWAHLVAAPLAFVGATDEALELLSQGADAGFINYPMLAEHDPYLSSLRADPRFEALLERVRKEWEVLEVAG